MKKMINKMAAGLLVSTFMLLPMAVRADCTQDCENQHNKDYSNCARNAAIEMLLCALIPPPGDLICAAGVLSNQVICDADADDAYADCLDGCMQG